MLGCTPNEGITKIRLVSEFFCLLLSFPQNASINLHWQVFVCWTDSLEPRTLGCQHNHWSANVPMFVTVCYWSNLMYIQYFCWFGVYLYTTKGVVVQISEVIYTNMCHLCIYLLNWLVVSNIFESLTGWWWWWWWWWFQLNWLSYFSDGWKPWGPTSLGWTPQAHGKFCTVAACYGRRQWSCTSTICCLAPLSAKPSIFVAAFLFTYCVLCFWILTSNRMFRQF